MDTTDSSYQDSTYNTDVSASPREDGDLHCYRPKRQDNCIYPYERGPTGPAGATGMRGPIGARGLKGDVGGKGPAGPAGGLGCPGEKGDKGDRGHKGDVGDRGCRGYNGEPGPNGTPGATGCTGLQGQPGTVANNFTEYIVKFSNVAGVGTAPVLVDPIYIPLSGSVGGYAMKYNTDDTRLISSLMVNSNSAEGPNSITFTVTVAGGTINKIFMSTGGGSTYNPLSFTSSNGIVSYGFTDNTQYNEFIFTGAVYSLIVRWA